MLTTEHRQTPLAPFPALAGRATPSPASADELAAAWRCPLPRLCPRVSRLRTWAVHHVMMRMRLASRETLCRLVCRVEYLRHRGKGFGCYDIKWPGITRAAAAPWGAASKQGVDVLCPSRMSVPLRAHA